MGSRATGAFDSTRGNKRNIAIIISATIIVVIVVVVAVVVIVVAVAIACITMIWEQSGLSLAP